MPIFSASSSSCLMRTSAVSFACLSSFAVGKPVILAFSSVSYRMRLSRGETCDSTVEGLRYEASTSLWSACEYNAGPATHSGVHTEKNEDVMIQRTFDWIVCGQV